MTETDALARIERFGDLEPDWDSYGAYPVTAKARENAAIIVRAFAAHGMSVPFPFPTVRGGVALEWAPDDLAITVAPDGRTCVWAEPMEDCEPASGPAPSSAPLEEPR